MHEETIGEKQVYQGRVLDLQVLDVRLADGTESIREVVRHRGAAAVLAREADGPFLFVRQFRKPVECECLEIVAGLLEKGEQPDDCARREVREETGCRVTRLVSLGRVWSSPGYSDESITLFYAEVVPDGPASPEDDERVDVVRMSLREFEAALAEGQIRDAKTLAAWALFRQAYPGEQKGTRRDETVDTTA